MDFSDSVSVVGVSDDTSPELLMLSLLLCFAEKLMVEFENKEAFLGVEACMLLPEMYSVVAAVVDRAMTCLILSFLVCYFPVVFLFKTRVDKT